MTTLELIDKIHAKLTNICSCRDVILADMQVKMKRADWHGVADAAMDMRDLGAEETALTSVLDLLAGDKLSS